VFAGTVVEVKVRRMEGSQVRMVIDAEGVFSATGPKLALGVLRYRGDDVVAVIDSRHDGMNTREVTGDTTLEPKPVVADLAAALRYQPDTFVIGLSLMRPIITPDLRSHVLAAIGVGLNVVSGLHYILGQDPEISTAARDGGVTLWDLRCPDRAVEVGEPGVHRPGSWTTLAVGSDCSTGKMTTMLEIEREARRRGLSSAFVATGQTGILIAGHGVPADHLISDFLNGAVASVVRAAADRHDWVFVEGQGALNHPAYSPVALGVLHGAAPDSMILCHRALSSALQHQPHHRIPPVPTVIGINEQAASWLGDTRTCRVVGISLNTSHLGELASRYELARVADETGLPAEDVIRFGAGTLLDAIVSASSCSS
jgi:D-glutamate N-acetyltransferase